MPLITAAKTIMSGEDAAMDEEGGLHALTTEELVLIFGVLTSIATFIGNAVITRAETKRARRLELLKEQLGSFYGPMMGRIEAGKEAMSSARMALKQKRLMPREALFEDEACTRENKSFRWFESGIEQDVQIVMEWRRWVREVIHPNNEAMLEILLNETHRECFCRSDGTRSLSPLSSLSLSLSLRSLCLTLSLSEYLNQNICIK